MSSVRVEIQDRELWAKFSRVTNEMIVTKSGRRMFPVVRIQVSGLEDNGLYRPELEFVQVGAARWKYMNGGWVSGGKAEAPPNHCIYQHPDAPNFGSFWTNSEGISFSKVKLTNKPNPPKGQVKINHLYPF